MSWDGKTYDKYRIAHTDGTPLKGKSYFVLRLDSDNPAEAARVNAAMRVYKGRLRNCDRFNTGDVKQDAQDAMEAILDEGVAGFRGIAEYLLSPVCTEQKGETMEANDMKTMREVLVTIRRMLMAMYESEAEFRRLSHNKPLVDLIDAALSKPPRNCDVGSEEEQSRRYEAFCDAHHTQCDKGCSACPCSKKSGVSCELYWAQMPYEAQEGSEEK